MKRPSRRDFDFAEDYQGHLETYLSYLESALGESYAGCRECGNPPIITGDTLMCGGDYCSFGITYPDKAAWNLANYK